ncbi:rho guanine nucleotide exchange factor 10 isoform X2 [Electrophorus electricus]|uniref:rho guanine nucleotide exchange factor 10 isoform X2 n=1 Tax=Electrophorus electricus TaxID=8005 RepID=UPI0015D04CC8|nr:rho guanine nucleotide exchange factor 10 isoform X2 [Electrophorus electricus]
METDDFPPPPPPDVLDDDDEEEGRCFEFDDSADEAPEADRPLPDPPALDLGPPSHQAAAATGPSPSSPPEGGVEPRRPNSEDAEVDLPRPLPNCRAPGTPSSTSGAPCEDFPPPPQEEPTPDWSVAALSLAPDPPPPPEELATLPAPTGSSDLRAASGRDPQPKASPYSVIDIAPVQQQQVCQQSPPLSPYPSNGNEGEFQEVPSSPGVPSGYSVPVPCGYATPSSVPVIVPAYTTPIIIRHLSVDDVTVVGAGGSLTDSVFSEEHPAIKEEDALAKWVSDPANMAWMESPDEVIYDDVPRENTGSTTDLEEMIYDDVEHGEEGSSSLDNGWSSSEFESYDETSDHENGHAHNGIPSAFVRRPSRKTHLSQDLTRLKEHYERRVRDIMANTVGTVELQQLRHKHEKKVQRLVKAAKDGTKDSLERTRAAMKKGKSFIRTKSFCQERKMSCFEEEEPEVFIEVDCFNVEPVLSPAPEGLSEQQVVRRCILESILESEKSYLQALKRILEYEKPLLEIEPQLLSRRKCKVVFHRVRDILQCHALFQIALASRVADWDLLQTIGDVFVASFSKSMVLDAYGDYVNNFSTAMGAVRKACSSKPGFLEFLKQRQECNPERLSLYGLLIKPIQRFPQFIVLLQEMLRHTPVGHTDRLPLQMALTELETLAEKLAEKKREADQRCEIKHIAKAMNERYLNKLLSSGTRYLIRSDDVVETVYNDRGEIVKTKERRLFLLSDVLMCATPNTRSPLDGAGGGGGGPSGQRFLLKWSVPLSLVEVVEFGSTEDMGDSASYPAPHSGDKVVINAQPNKLYMGPGQLYQDLQNLVHDLGLVNQISAMIGSLKGNYQNVNGTVAQDWVSGLQCLILKKEDEIRAADRCRIQLQLPGKQDKSGRPTFFSAVFNTFGPSIKQAWISHLQMARLALDEDNVQGWFCAEDDSNLIQKQKHPLLLKRLPVVMSRLQEFKVECAVHNPEPHVNSESTADMPAVGHGCVWVASCTNQMGQIAVVAMENSSPKVTECFNVESRILCMAYVPPGEPLEDGKGAEHCGPPGTGSTPTVCVGLEEGSVCVYRSSQRCKKVRLQYFPSPDRAAVMCLAYSSSCLYVGLVSGALAVYSRTTGGVWDASSAHLLQLGVLPVKALLAVGDHVWASSGGQVFVVNARTHAVEHQVEVHQDEGMVVSHLAVAGVGIWIAFSSGSTLRLFHTETLEHLQDISIAAPINNALSGHQRVSVSSLLVCHGLLLVGTNLGVTVALSVPRLQGIPKVIGRGMVSFHAHHGPVKFLTAATPVHNLQQGRGAPPTTSPSPPAPVEGSGLSETPASDGAVWLGDAAGPGPGPGPGRRDSLSSSSGSLALSHSSLEHGPEHGNIYDLLSDPARTHGAKRAWQVEVSSLLVVSGGLGHRRLNWKSKHSRHDESVSTIMVWQIPVPSS